MELSFKNRIEAVDSRFSTLRKLEAVQVNLGDLCNLSCAHCHHNASPHGTRIMGREVMEKIVDFLAARPGLTLDITGGCPEMNPHFRFFVEATAGLSKRRIIRSNLAVVLEPGMEWLPGFYREQELVIMASLPCYGSDNVEKQRGNGVFSSSIQVLRTLNAHGYGGELELHLVHNPGNGSVAGPQDALEKAYKTELLQHFGISFSTLHCINNVPIGRFRDQLERKGDYDRYLEHLSGRFNPDAAAKIMCRTLVSVGWDGTLYNCDFNLAAGLPLKKADGTLLTIDHIHEAPAPGSAIELADHCFSCTAGDGSGCGGLVDANGNGYFQAPKQPGQNRRSCQQH